MILEWWLFLSLLKWCSSLSFFIKMVLFLSFFPGYQPAMIVLSTLARRMQNGGRRLLFNEQHTGTVPSWNLPFRGLRQPRKLKRDGGMKLAPFTLMENSSETSMGVGLMRSLIFTGTFCGATFVGASIWQYETVRHSLQQNSWQNWTKNSWDNLQGWQHKEGEFRKAINNWWNGLNDGQKVFWPLCLLNGIVFACWHHPALQSTMFRYFCSNPAARAVCWPMLLSTFSHFSFIHFGLNMYVLHSFSSGVGRSLGKEQFLAMYMSGGVVSSLVSHAFKVAMRCPGPSLGASGAIMALLGYFCTHYPEAQLSIVFIPGFSFSADTAIKAIMCLDAAGMAMGWRLFDHAAHFGGALFGLFYAYFGPKYIWANTEPVMKKWHQLRTDVNGKIADSKKDD